MNDVKTVKLARGGHKPGQREACVMEVVSMLHGEQFSDTPACTCPALGTFARILNDHMTDEERQMLWPFTLRLGGTNNPVDTKHRAFRMADWAVREILPMRLDDVGRRVEAEMLRCIPAIVDKATAEFGGRAADAAYAAAAYTSAAAAAAYAYDDAAAYDAAAYAAAAYTSAGALSKDRARYIDKAVALLDELCPPAPSACDAELLNWIALDEYVTA